MQRKEDAMPDGSIDATQSPNKVLDRLSPRILGG